VFFARVENDGFRIKKGVRIPCEGSELPQALDAYESKATVPGFCGWAKLDSDLSFAPGAYIPARQMSEQEVNDGVLAIIRGRTAFVALHAKQLVGLNQNAGRSLRSSRKAVSHASKPGTIGHYFDIFYGLKTLHNKEALLPGNSLVISSSGMDNGCYGFFDFEDVLEPAFVTVPSTGSIGVAHVQEWPCGVTDDCLMLLPKPGINHAILYIAAAVVRGESWRFSYGRKATPDRIADFPLPVNQETLDRIDDYLSRASRAETMLLTDAEDSLDVQIAQSNLIQIASGSIRVVRGDELLTRLDVLDRE
jgi:hypothetical protein